MNGYKGHFGPRTGVPFFSTVLVRICLYQRMYIGVVYEIEKRRCDEQVVP